MDSAASIESLLTFSDFFNEKQYLHLFLRLIGYYRMEFNPVYEKNTLVFEEDKWKATMVDQNEGTLHLILNKTMLKKPPMSKEEVFRTNINDWDLTYENWQGVFPNAFVEFVEY
jgi:hypothetical protein